MFSNFIYKHLLFTYVQDLVDAKQLRNLLTLGWGDNINSQEKKQQQMLISQEYQMCTVVLWLSIQSKEYLILAKARMVLDGKKKFRVKGERCLQRHNHRKPFELCQGCRRTCLYPEYTKPPAALCKKGKHVLCIYNVPPKLFKHYFT